MTPDLASIQAAADRLATLVAAEAAVIVKREELEAEIQASLIGSDNPMTSKPHSASSAAEAAKQTAEVKALRAERVKIECDIIRARAAYECAKIAAWATIGTPALALAWRGQ